MHIKNTFRVQLWRKPVLQGWRDANGLWRLSRDETKPIRASRSKQEVAANVYSLPSMPQTIRYLHAAAGFPPKILGSRQSKMETMPHGRESLPKHMKKQRQNVRSTKQKLIVDGTTVEIELTRTITKQNILVKVTNASETVFTDQTGWFPVQSNRGRIHHS